MKKIKQIKNFIVGLLVFCIGVGIACPATCVTVCAKDVDEALEESADVLATESSASEIEEASSEVIEAEKKLSVSGKNYIHFLAFPQIHTDAILLESVDENGQKIFGLIDAAEDTDYPKDTDRDVTKDKGFEDAVIAYLKKQGVTQYNLEFVLGTHHHSDHIGCMDEVINCFKPKRVYIMKFDDSYITSEDRRWDIEYVYKQMVDAAKANHCTLIQNFSVDAPVTPGMSDVGNPNFSLGQMQISVKNYERVADRITAAEKPDNPITIFDDNSLSLGVLVEVNNKRIFLAGDIDNNEGDEDALATEVAKVDLLKLGHHGGRFSSTPYFMRTLDPDVIVQTGRYETFYKNKIAYSTLWDATNGMNVVRASQGRPCIRFYCCESYAKKYDSTGKNITALVFKIDSTGIYQDVEGGRAHMEMVTYASNSDGLKAWYFIDGLRYDEPVTDWVFLKQNVWDDFSIFGWYYVRNGKYCVGWEKIDGQWYYFDKSGIMQTGWQYIGNAWYYFVGHGEMRTGWLQENGKWYYFQQNGMMVTGWQRIDGRWYYFDNGAVVTGWKKIDGKWYYFNDYGMITGWKKIDGKWYYFGDYGMVTGWKKINGKWYYFGDYGMVTGWRKIDGKWYFFGDYGLEKTWNK